MHNLGNITQVLYHITCYIPFLLFYNFKIVLSQKLYTE